jgi:hypothetical protein
MKRVIRGKGGQKVGTILKKTDDDRYCGVPNCMCKPEYYCDICKNHAKLIKFNVHYCRSHLEVPQGVSPRYMAPFDKR